MLQNTALIVTLSLSKWTARKLDKQVTDETNEAHGASKDAGRYNKLLANKEYLKPLEQVFNKTRTFHYENTLSWGDNGDRILPSVNYFTYIQKINELKIEAEKEIETFISVIDDIKARAKKELNGMYREADYPSKYELESKFNFKISMMPVPDTDFRVQLDASEIEALKKAAETEFSNRINKAAGEAWERIEKVLTHMKSVLNDPEKIFRDSLFENVRDLITLLPKLNFNNDPAINDVCNEMSTLLIDDPNNIRENAMLRKRKAADADKVLNKFNSFFS
jgi:hypothetical protein